MGGVDRLLKYTARGMRWLAPWASVLLVSSVLAYSLDVALITCCSETPQIATTPPTQTNDFWRDGAMDRSKLR